MEKKILPFCFLILPLLLFAQENTSNDTIKKNIEENLKFTPKQLIIPAVLFTYGIVAIESDYLKLINTQLRDELKEKY